MTSLFFKRDTPRALGAGVGVGVCSGSEGGRTTHEGVCIGYKAACSPMWGHVVGIWVEERVGLVLGSS